MIYFNLDCVAKEFISIRAQVNIEKEVHQSKSVEVFMGEKSANIKNWSFNNCLSNGVEGEDIIIGVSIKALRVAILLLP